MLNVNIAASAAFVMIVPRLRQITTPTPRRSIFTDRMLFLVPSQQCRSTEGQVLSANTVDKQESPDGSYLSHWVRHCRYLWSAGQWLEYSVELCCCPAPMPDTSQRRPRQRSGSTSEPPLPLPRWVTGELPAPDVYLQVLEAATG